MMYFGCLAGLAGRTAVGHGLYDERYRTVRGGWRLVDRVRFEAGAHLDGGFCPRVGRVEAPQGHAQLTLVPDFTVLAFWDRSGDSRGGSHSTFLLAGHHAFADALDRAREAFPAVFERFGQPVVQWKAAG